MPYTGDSTLTVVTCSPTWATVPAKSDPTIAGNERGILWAKYPSRKLISDGFTPAACTRISTSSGPIEGTGRSITWRRSGPPYALIAIARIVDSFLALSQVLRPETASVLKCFHFYEMLLEQKTISMASETPHNTLTEKGESFPSALRSSRLIHNRNHLFRCGPLPGAHAGHLPPRAAIFLAPKVERDIAGTHLHVLHDHF